MFSFNSNLSAATPTIIVLGDSLSAAFGLEQNDGWVHLLQQHLKKENYNYNVINASISGETTAGGLARSQSLLTKHQPEILILELGANDGLRGLPLSVMRDNLSQIIKQAQSINTRVLLLGMRLPPNYGPDYTQQFHQSYLNLAAQHKTAIMPFLFQDLNDNPLYFQKDNLHPNANAQPILLKSMLPALKPLLITTK